ncbi:MAG: PD-(D/E)XK nuclease family protein, partial [Firmicutes bacterium]|nr:PD-(D/E)XK nuclease family protein [Bacillota bacterium]
SLTKKAEAVMKEVLLKKDYKELLEKPENKMILKIVKAETPKLAYNILYHHVSSNFRPTKKSLEKKINFDMGDFVLKGKADRVDFCENQFRIIDYKTGSSEKKFSFAELFYGQALQLPLYALGVQSETKKKAVGIFYYPAHNKKKENEFSARLSGPVLNDIIVLRNLDNAFNRDYEAENGIISETITAAINKAGTRENRWHYPKSMLDNSDFQKMLDYAKSVTKSGVGEILKGYVEPSVLEDQRLPCEFCPYMKLGQCENKILRTKKNIKM